VEFFFHLGFAINRWAFVERELFHVFRFLLGNTSDSAASYLFYKQPTTALRFSMVDTLVDAILTPSHKNRWAGIKKRFNKEIPLRNRLAHDPSNQIVSAAGSVGSSAPPPVPPPIWELQWEPAKLLQSKKPGDLQPVNVTRIVTHISEVTDLQNELSEFRKKLPIRLPKQAAPTATPKANPVRNTARRKRPPGSSRP
jgi:hypothetical protein